MKKILLALAALAATLSTPVLANTDISHPLARSLGAPTATMALQAPQKALQRQKARARAPVARKAERPVRASMSLLGPIYKEEAPRYQTKRAVAKGTVTYAGITWQTGGGSLGPTRGRASYYWQGNKTASGEPFKADGISCAHRTLAFGTMLRVTNLSNGRSVTCRVNNRGPFIQGRIVDLSRGAARQIGMLQAGVVPVEISIVR